MVTGWIDLVGSVQNRNKKEFVSVDARLAVNKDTRAYEMLSRDSSAVVTPLTPVKSPMSSGRRTPDYFGQTARYQPPARSFSSPKPPPVTWEVPPTQPPLPQTQQYGYEEMNPLGMNRI